MPALFRRKTGILICLILLLAGVLHAQSDEQEQIKSRQDSSFKLRDSTRVKYFYSDFETLGKLVLINNDTALEGFQHYDPLLKQNRFFQTLGNIGLGYNPIDFSSRYSAAGFDYGSHSLDSYLFVNDSVKYYKVDKTFTELIYVQGAKKEQNFQAKFSRNLYKSLNLGFDFRVRSSPGAYSRQKTNHVNFVLTTQFFTRNKRYGVIANLLFNRLRNYENGGIKYDSLFTENLESNRAVIPVNLASARNNVRESGFFMKHYFDISPKNKRTRDTTYIGNFPDLGRLSYSFHYHRQIQNFIDNQPDSGFFPPPVFDSVQTYDSITNRWISNEISWSNPSFRADLQPRVLQVRFGLRQVYAVSEFRERRDNFMQFIPNASLRFHPIGSIDLQANAHYIVGDYNEGDFEISARLAAVLGKKNRNAGSVAVNAALKSTQPAWFYSHYAGNNYQWDTSWRKINIIETGFSYSWKYFTTGFELDRIKNYIFINQEGRPRQETNEFAYMKIYLNSMLKVWRFAFNTQLLYQTIQGTTAVRLPAFIGQVTVYYEQPLFKGAAILEPGLECFYHTSYYADHYNPALRQFTLQDVREIGNYPFLDVFINLKIQRARFFATYTHFNAGLMSHTYFTTPGYPMQDGAFKFGITWRFHD